MGVLVNATSLGSSFELSCGGGEVFGLLKELVHVEVEGIVDALVLVDLRGFGLAIHAVTRAVDRHESVLLLVFLEFIQVDQSDPTRHHLFS